MNQRILITGGAGFIGAHLAEHLARAGYAVTLLDNFDRGIADAWLTKLLSEYEISLNKIDLLDRESVLSQEKTFDAIFHLAAIVGVKHVLKRPYDVMVDNIRMLDNVLALARIQSSLSRLLFASTSEVYAGTLKHYDLVVPTPEVVPLTSMPISEPRSSYMLSKIVGEAMCQQAEVPFTIFRPHNVYGPRMGMAHVIPEQLRKAFRANSGDELPVHSANHTRAFSYIDDVIEMLRRMLESESCGAQTLNLGTEAPEVTIREVVQTCVAVTGKSLGTIDLPAISGSPERRAPDMRLAKELLGYESKVGLFEGISKTWDWYREYVFEGGELTAQ